MLPRSRREGAQAVRVGERGPVVQIIPDQRPGQNRHDGAHSDQTVGRGNIFIADDFRDGRVLGRRVKRALGPHQEQNDEKEPRVPDLDEQDPEQHDQNFRRFAEDHDAPFAKTVRAKTAVARKKNERDEEH